MNINQEQLLAQSQELLDTKIEDITEDSVVKESIEMLCEVIQKHSHLYYIEEAPIINDFEWDQLFQLLKDLESAHPQHLSQNSPTQKITLEVQTGFKKAEHSIPMISLGNTYNEEDLLDFDKQLARLLPEESNREYIIELKLDGIGISLIYEEGKLIRAATRGNGLIGEDVTANTQTIFNIPKTIPYQERLEVRGEIVLPKKELERINIKREKEGQKAFVNTRNAASGSMRQLDTAVTAERKLEAYFYQLILDNSEFKIQNSKLLSTYVGQMEFLKEQGFEISAFLEKAESIEQIVEHCHAMEEKRYSFPFDIDGLVIKLNSLELQKHAGATQHHPKWAMAYKFPAEQVQTTIHAITLQVGRTGVITPVAELEPVNLSGATLRRATLHNFEDIERKDIRIGDTIVIERAGEVIPKVIKSIVSKRTGNEEIISIPQTCPICESIVIHHEGEVAYRCGNIDCPAQVKGRITHYASRQGLDIDGLGISVVNSLVDLKIIESIPDIYNLKNFESIRKLEKIEGLGPKALNNLFDALETSKTMPLERLLHALGIQFIGKKGAQVLANNVDSLHDLKTKTVEELIELRDMGEKTAQSIVDFFANESNRRILHELEEAGVQFNIKDQSDLYEPLFENKIVVFTGSLEHFSRPEAQGIVEKLGGKTSSSLSKNTTILICGKNAGSKKQQAEELGVLIQSEQEFLDQIPKELQPEIKESEEDQMSLF